MLLVRIQCCLCTPVQPVTSKLCRLSLVVSFHMSSSRLECSSRYHIFQARNGYHDSEISLSPPGCDTRVQSWATVLFSGYSGVFTLFEWERKRQKVMIEIIARGVRVRECIILTHEGGQRSELYSRPGRLECRANDDGTLIFIGLCFCWLPSSHYLNFFSSQRRNFFFRDFFLIVKLLWVAKEHL